MKKAGAHVLRLDVMTAFKSLTAQLAAKYVMVAGYGIGCATRMKLAEIEVPFWVNAMVASVGAIVSPGNDGPGV